MCTQRDFTEVGSRYSTGKMGRIGREIESLEWHEARKGLELPMMQGIGIGEAIKQLGLPKVSHVAYNGCIFGSYGFYGIRAHYKNADVDVFVIDSGTDITVTCMDVTVRQ